MLPIEGKKNRKKEIRKSFRGHWQALHQCEKETYLISKMIFFSILENFEICLTCNTSCFSRGKNALCRVFFCVQWCRKDKTKLNKRKTENRNKNKKQHE